MTHENDDIRVGNLVRHRFIDGAIGTILQVKKDKFIEGRIYCDVLWHTVISIDSTHVRSWYEVYYLEKLF